MGFCGPKLTKKLTRPKTPIINNGWDVWTRSVFETWRTIEERRSMDCIVFRLHPWIQGILLSYLGMYLYLSWRDKFFYLQRTELIKTQVQGSMWVVPMYRQADGCLVYENCVANFTITQRYIVAHCYSHFSYMSCLFCSTAVSNDAVFCGTAVSNDVWCDTDRRMVPQCGQHGRRKRGTGGVPPVGKTAGTSPWN